MKHDWARAKAAYVEAETPVSLDEVARRLKITPARLRERAGKEKWVEARDEYRAKVERQRSDRKAKEAGREQADFDTRCLQLFESMMGLAAKGVVALSKQATPDARELMRLTQAARNAQHGARIALGLPTLPIGPVGQPIPGAVGAGARVGVMRFEWVDDDPTQGY